mgnify:CR=1 FL=1
MKSIRPSVGRLAPSPTGALHLGNARTFLIAWLEARARGGRVILRMEDLDHPKVKPGAAHAALADLRWLGLDWDEGPDVGGPHAPYVQSQRIEHYAAALAALQAKGRVYPCACTRRDVAAGQSAPHAGDTGPVYGGHCRGRFPDYPAAARHRNATFGAQALAPSVRDGDVNRLPAWRFIPKGITEFPDGFHGVQRDHVATSTGDFVIARHANGAGYMLAVVVDDAGMGITEVVRGDDLLPATHLQLQLYRALELRAPRFVHVPLVVSEDGKRLAKRHGDTRIETLRQSGIDAATVVGLLAWWCGWTRWGAKTTPHDLLACYRLDAIPCRPVVLDRQVRRYLGIREPPGR